MGSVPNIAARVFGCLAAVFLAAMMLLTVADVASRWLFNTPIRGMLDLIELGLACTFFLALPAVFLRDEHLVVDAIDPLVSRRTVRLLDLAGAVISLVVLAVIAWQMLPLARSMIEFGDVSSDLAIPKLYYWLPVLIGIIASGVATLAYIARWRSRA